MSKRLAWLTVFWVLAGLITAPAAPTGRTTLSGHVLPAARKLTPVGRLAATNELFLTLALPLHNETALDELDRQLYDPTSTNYHRFLSVAEFTARFGPTETEYQAVMTFARSNGFKLVSTRLSRTILDVTARAGDVERAFGLTLRTYRHPVENREFFAPDSEPSVLGGLQIVAVEGLNNYARPRPLARLAPLGGIAHLNGSGPSGYLAGNDFHNAYALGSPLAGTGQTLGLLEISDYYGVDVTNYESTIGLTNYVPLTNVVVGTGTPDFSGNGEAALDIEVAIAMAPALTRVIVYEQATNSFNPSSLLSRMANDNLAKQLSSSWAWSGGPSSAVDSALKQMITQGQSFFQASGDSDAYTGANTLDSTSLAVNPVDSTNLVSVGATTLTMNGSGASWASESVWNYAYKGGADANLGSSGGISSYYRRPKWQSGVNMTTNSGSTTWRNIPDVAMSGDLIFIDFDNGSQAYASGTSCAAPLWAALTALINQQALLHPGGTPVGFLNPALYNIGTNAAYSACFHDITNGNNIGNNTAGRYYATDGFDLASGWGTPAGTNLINTLAPGLGFLTPPTAQNVTNNGTATFAPVVLGAPPFHAQWQLAGTNLPGATNISLSLHPVAASNAGNYALIVTNTSGAVTSSVVALTVLFPPTVTGQPTNLTVLSGSNAAFSATVSGTAPLAYQWLKNSAPLANGTGISGATTNTLSLTAVTTNSNGSYSLAITNLYGAVTSSIALLDVGFAPTLSGNLTNHTLQCGSNNLTFTITAAGTAPIHYQWNLDGSPVTSATNSTFTVTNLLSPSHSLAVTATNLFGAATNSAILTVVDTLPPVITLLGANPYYQELGNGFTDPGAIAADLCIGPVGISVSGSVTTNLLGTNTLTYTAGDGNGNTNTATRIVIVQYTNPPAILWSFTNLVLSAVSNCAALLPNLTGTNGIVATDPSSSLIITQSPTNNTQLPLGTNFVIFTVTDSSGNTARSTNTVTVVDAEPPVFATQPAGSTNATGTTATFTATATACSPLTWSWFFGTNALAPATNNTLTLTNLTLAQAGDYYAIASSAGGSTTSSVAILNVGCPPVITNPPANLSVVSGGSATFTAGVTGTGPFAYQWVLNGTNLTDGPTLSGSATGTLSLSAVTTNNSGSYALAVTNLYGAATSSTARLTVGFAPTVSVDPTNQTLECGSNLVTFTATAAGTPPFRWQWSLDGTPVADATNTTFSVTNLLAPSHSLTVAVTNLYGSATNSLFLAVTDTQPPVITLTGPNPIYLELGSAFTDPGATATDACVGTVSVSVSGSVNATVLGTNLVTYTADDGDGNTNTATRIVIVQYTNPPAILWSFTNFVLSAGSDCAALMPDLTGTNGVLATDPSSPLTVTETPTNGASLALGTNPVIFTITDSSGNTAWSTNTITVVDISPPVLVMEPQNLTNLSGTTATFTAAATACTPVAWAWFFRTNPLTTATSSTLTLSNVSRLAAGNYFTVATSAGGSVTSSVATLTVNLQSATITPAASLNPAGYLDGLSFSADLTPTNATGSVQFLTNGVPFDWAALANGTATSTNTTALPRGTNVITVIYSGDNFFFPATNQWDELVTNHPPVGLPVTYTYGAGTALAIALTNLAGYWSDPDGDLVSLATITMSTNGVTVTNDAGTLTYFNPANVNDQFTCTLTDSWGGTNYQTVTLNVVFPLISGATFNPDGSLSLRLQGWPGATYVLLTTPTLLPVAWQPIATNTLDSTGRWNYTTGPLTNAPQTFYELQLQP